MLDSFIDRSKEMSIIDIIREINCLNRSSYEFNTYKHVLYLEVSRRVHEVINDLENDFLNEKDIVGLNDFIINGEEDFWKE